MKHPPSFLLALVLGLLASAPLAAQGEWGEEEAPCAGALRQPAELAGLLARVGKYQSTYVLVFREEHAEEVAALDAPAVADLRLAVHAESPAAAMAAGAGLSGYQTPAFDPADAGAIVAGVLAGDLDVGLVWAPLAGLAVLELDLDYALSLRTAGGPTPPPAALAAAASAEASECAAAIESLLGGYGVVPAEKLVKVDVRDLLHLRPPPRDDAAARRGAPLYARHCARCHGPDAVAAPDALAPVDLLRSTPRFSFPGFLYIVWNGRSQNGMPGFRGALTQEEVELIYQYARERSHDATAQGAP